MLQRLFPPALTNAYQGMWAAIWLLLPILLMKTVIGFNFSGLNPFIDVGSILQTVDGVPLNTFSPSALASVLDSASSWGMALFTLCLIVWVVLIRYRSGLPLAILLLMVEQLGRTGLDTIVLLTKFASGTANPAAGAIINLSMTTGLLGAFLLSLVPARQVSIDAPS